MTQIDFIMAIVVTLGIIMFSISYVSADYTNQMNEMNIIELKASADVLENQLVQNITENMSLMKVSFKEMLGVAHTETITFQTTSSTNQYTIYEEKQLVLTSSDPFVIPITLAPNQVRYFDIYYSGSTSVTTITGGDGNVSIRLLSEQSYPVISEDLCKLIDYNETRKIINHDFKIKIGTCDVGLEPPKETVVVNSFPVVLKTLESVSAKIMVW